MSSLDPESRVLLEEVLPRYSPSPEMSAEPARRLALELGKLLQGDPAPMENVRDLRTSSPAGDIPIRVYRPAEADGGWLLWVHGGGFMTGGLDTHDLLCRRLAAGIGQTVISVDYRLAPEHPFPAALDDCRAVLEWLARDGKSLGIDPMRGSIGGSSAGGNLAAAIVLSTESTIPLRCQALVYPCVDATMSLSRGSQHSEGYQLTSAMMAHYLDAYCGLVPDKKNPALSPLFANSLAGSPPTLVIIAELDPLADEGLAYAHRLAEEGIPTTTHVFEGVMHGFFAQAGALTKAREAQAKLCNFVRDSLQSL